jgi:hypothetical protein
MEMSDNVHHLSGRNKFERCREIEQTFTPWYEDVYRMADLWRWLRWRAETSSFELPKDFAYFLTHGQDWTEEYVASRMWKGESV